MALASRDARFAYARFASAVEPGTQLIPFLARGRDSFARRRGDRVVIGDGLLSAPRRPVRAPRRPAPSPTHHLDTGRCPGFPRLPLSDRLTEDMITLWIWVTIPAPNTIRPSGADQPEERDQQRQQAGADDRPWRWPAREPRCRRRRNQYHNREITIASGSSSPPFSKASLPSTACK